MLVNPRGALVLLPLLALVVSPAIHAVDAPPNVSTAWGKVPLQFEENRAGEAVRFVAHGPGYSLHLTSDEAVLVLSKPSEMAGQSESVALQMSVVGARSTSAMAGVDELPGRASYFIGNDPSKWRTNIPTYAKVRYSGVYPGIDLVYYGQQRQLEYDFVLAAGADVGQITLGFTGANDLEIDAQGDLVLHTAVGDVRQRRPVVYQEADGIRREVEGRYVRKGKTRIGFEVAEYDRGRPLVIDPVIVFSTLLPGVAGGIGVDAAGNVYVSGLRGNDVPTTPGAFNAPNLPLGAFVTKLNSTGSAVLYSAFIGGADNAFIAVDAAGNVYLTGSTNKVNFPTTPGALRTSWPDSGLRAAFVTKLNPAGSALVYSTYLGGSGIGESSTNGTGIAVDAGGNAYVTGLTSAFDFPVTAGVVQTSKLSLTNFSRAAFLSKLNPTGSALVYSTYLGGSGATNTGGSRVAVDAAGEAFVLGSTDAADFPLTAGAFNTTPPVQFQTVNFVAKFDATGSALVYSTLFGRLTSIAIAVDAPGHAYVVGNTGSPDFSVTPGAFQATNNGDADATVAKFNLSGSALVYATFLGGAGREQARDIAVDADGNAFVTGDTSSTDFPTTGNACEPASRGNVDTFVTMLDPSGSKVVYSTYIGGSENDSPTAIAVDAGGTAYVAGNTRSTAAHCPQDAPSCPNDFPTTTGAFQKKFDGSGGAAFVVKIAEPVLPAESPPPAAPAASSAAAPAATTQLAEGGTQSGSGGGGAIDWLTLPALLVALAFARRRRAER